MKFEWTKRDNREYVARDVETNELVLHIARRSATDITCCGTDRYCVFAHGLHAEYAGDLPTDMSVNDLKAAAITLARISGYLS